MAVYLDELYNSAKDVFEMMGEFIGSNTFFIAINDGKVNRVVQTFNKKTSLVDNETIVNFQDSY
ncbi:hypothetical protein [Halalkalibacter akibai]|uniref:Uncharacterized protein n=1 Tax=Halalkalibacter akibai (strain ATCC 43226 / DSM 21942 / CIP 109018 / JCM 9157 / 1139) TaxID=1236973 RepID=W4QSX7_HALA3|nr:hypothetical protein [Halalkalibacter akibai]GAE35211.1 hypothetical protein JCM9157_2310 [Halalkalibacter akibai JCM 9157]